MSISATVIEFGRAPRARRPACSASNRRIRGLLLTVMVFSTLPTSPAFAAEVGDKTKAARLHYQKGEDAFKAGDYPEAVKEFEAGFALVNRPGFLLNMAHAYRRMNELKKARALYKSYLLADPDSAERDEVESVIKEIDSAIQAEAESRPDTRKEPARTLAEPGPPSGTTMLGTTLTTATTVPPPADDAGHFYSRWWFWTLVGTAVVGGVTAGVLIAKRPHYDADGSLGTLGRP